MLFFFFNDTATTEIYPLSLHDALPISAPPACAKLARRPARGTRRARSPRRWLLLRGRALPARRRAGRRRLLDRKSTRLNSSHANISYAVFCLKKKKTKPCGII